MTTTCQGSLQATADSNLKHPKGVMESNAVLEAQAAWLQAQSQRIDAEIDVKLSQVALKKALGILHE